MKRIQREVSQPERFPLASERLMLLVSTDTRLGERRYGRHYFETR